MIPMHALQVVNDLLLTLVGSSDAKELTAGFMQRLMYHTGYPVASLVARTDARAAWTFEQVLGNRELARWIGKTPQWLGPWAEGGNEAFELTATSAQHDTFIGASHYRHALRLNVTSDLVLILIGPSAPAHAHQLPALFEAVLPRLDKARRLLIERADHVLQVSAEVERRRRVEASQRDSEAQAHALLELSPQPMFVIDLDTRQCVVVNARARELMGLAPAEALDTRGLFTRLIPDQSYRDEVRERLRTNTIEATRRDGLLEPIAVRLRDASGGERRAEIHTRVVSGRALVSIIDLTERLNHEQSLRSARDLAERVSNAKSQFLASVSHELRAPLLSILGAADALSDDQATTALQHRHAREVRESGRQLLALVDDVVDLGRLEAGGVQLERRVVDVGVVIRKVLEELAVQASERRVAMTFKCDRRLQVIADETRIHQTLTNLVSHAIRYNVDGGSVTVSCQSVGPGPRTRISVTDTGPESSSRGGKPFSRICAQDEDAPSSGIGPFIAKQLVELMGGDSGLTARPGQGCTFWFELPAPAVAPEAEPVSPSAPRILIAEDQPMNQRLLKLQLEQVGNFELTLVANGLEALRLLANADFDILLTDCNMPHIDGYRLTELVREQESHFGGHLPIVAITASALEEDLQRCLSAGMDACLSKPLSVGALADAVSRWQAAGPRSAASRPRREGYLLALGSMVGELGREALENLLDDFMISTMDLIEEARRHLANDAPELLSQVMHKVKPTAALVGAKALAAVAELIERAGKRNDLPLQKEVWPALEALWQRVTSDLATTSVPVPISDGDHHAVPLDDGLSELRALVIDDDPFTTRYVANMLSELGVARVAIAEDGASALQRMQTDNNVDVVLCDLAMPGMDGVELLRHLAESKLKASFIFMSGAGERVLESVEALARQHGFNVLGTIKKPVGREVLATLLRRHRPAASRRMARVLPQTSIGATSARPATPGGNNREPVRVTAEEVAQALALREITVHLQPKVRADSLQPIGVEALARWFRADGSFISPGVFVPIIESQGLQDTLFDLVLEQSLDVSRRLTERGYPLKISVNVSALSLERLEFVERVLDRTRRSGVDPHRLVLEVTETGLVRDQRVALDVLTRLRLHGIELSIDDFGTGYSSIDLLRRVPFTELKVDRSFIMTCVRDQSARHIISSSVGLARGLGMMVVAEGVETATELATVRELGCDEIQGYFTGRPMAESALLLWLAEHMRPLSPISAS